MKILITGGCGFVGSNLTKKLIEETDYHIVILDNLSSSTTKYMDSFDQSRITFVKGDIREAADIDKAIEGCSAVINLAAQAGVQTSIEDPLYDMDVNIKGIIQLFQACKKHGVKRFIQASSAAPLGKQKSVPVNEAMVPSPMSPYGASKLSGEGYCSAYAYSFGISSIVLRFSNIYGPLSDLKTSVIAKFIKKIEDGETIQIYGDGEQTRDFVHVDDICLAIKLGITAPVEHVQLIQLGTGVETSINKLVALFEEEYPGLTKAYADPLPGEILRNFTDISRAKEVLGYEPKHQLEEGLKETIDWFKNQ